MSMSTWGARKMNTVAGILQNVLGMEYLAASQGVELRRPLRSSSILESAISRLREVAPHLEEDRYMARDMAEAARLVEGLATIDG